jgi:hypothetical protein
MAEPLRIASAWDLIGFDGSDGQSVRILGGKTLYEAVDYRDDTPGLKVRLARLDVKPSGIRQVNRWVDPDEMLEVVKDG